MSIPLFFPLVIYVSALTLKHPLRLRTVCELAGVACKASGAWTERKIELTRGPEFRVYAEPGDWGSVRINLPHRYSRQHQARLALATLAYGMHDLVAKESIRGSEWLRPAPPRGRPRSGRAMSTKERQQRFREKRRK